MRMASLAECTSTSLGCSSSSSIPTVADSTTYLQEIQAVASAKSMQIS